MTKKKRTVALVLSGGSARGMAHIGVIEEILKNDFIINSIAGTSIGSVIGGVYISGKLPEFKDWITQVGKLDVFKLMDFAISKNGLIKGEKVFNELKRFIKDANIEDLDIPFSAVAVDILKHKEVVFKSGSIINAIRASVSIPTVLKPIIIDNMELVDGGVLNPLPMSCVDTTNSDVLIAVDLGADIPYQKPASIDYPESHDTAYIKAKEMINEKWSKFFKTNNSKHLGYFDLITESIYAMQMKLTQIAIEKYKPDILVQISRNACDLFEYHRAEELIEYGRNQFKLSLQESEIKL